jgi:hypothetical protein
VSRERNSAEVKSKTKLEVFLLEIKWTGDSLLYARNQLAGSPKQNTVTTKISGKYDSIGQATAPQELLTQRDLKPEKAGSKRMIDLAAEAKSLTWQQKEKHDGERICSGAETRWGRTRMQTRATPRLSP